MTDTIYTNEEIIKLYLMANRTYSDATRKGYTRHINDFLSFLGNKSVYEIRYIDLQEFIDYKIKIGNSITSTNNTSSALNSFFRYCKTMKITKDTLRIGTQKDKEKKERDSEKLRINSEMYNSIITSNEEYFNDKKMTMRDYRDKILLYILVYGGMRRIEIINLKLSNLKTYGEGENTKLQIDIRVSKGGKWRTVYLNKKCHDAMNDWLEARKRRGYNSEYIFCTESDKKMCDTESTLPALAKKFSLRAGISNEDGEGLFFSPHDYRHACGSMLAKNGVATVEIAKHLGDTKRTIEDVYIHKDTSASPNLTDCLI